MDALSKLYSRVNWAQKFAGYAAIVFAFTAVILTILYCSNTNEEEDYLGGLNWGELIFNWHPILMVSGLIFCSITSILAYRLVPYPKVYTKRFHGFLHACGIVCVAVGLAAVFLGNNYTNKNTGGEYYANLYSLHSFVGLGAIGLYCSNFVLGFLHYGMPVVPQFYKTFYMPSHVFVGSFAFFASVMAALTGLMELFKEYHCGYVVTSPDLNPAKHYHKLTAGCQSINDIGIIILVTSACAALALWENHALLLGQQTVDGMNVNGQPDEEGGVGARESTVEIPYHKYDD